MNVSRISVPEPRSDRDMGAYVIAADRLGTLYLLVSIWIVSCVAAFAAARDGFPRWDQADRAISTSKLHALLRFHTWPIDVVVFHGSRRDLVLRWVSRLDAFSGYPVRI